MAAVVKTINGTTSKQHITVVVDHTTTSARTTIYMKNLAHYVLFVVFTNVTIIYHCYCDRGWPSICTIVEVPTWK